MKRLPANIASIDQALLMIIGILLSIGLVMMSSASMDYAAQKFGEPFFYVIRQAVYLVMALAAMVLAYLVPTRFWNRHDRIFALLAIGLLVLVLLLGREINGSTRWIPLGIINLQASEPAKLFLLIFMAGYLVRRQKEVKENWAGFFKASMVLVFVSLLLLMEPDFGATVVILFSCFGMIFLAGLGLKQIAAALLLVAVAVLALIFHSAYRMQRVKCFIDPWAYAYDCGYQLTQSLIAFGRGEFFGLGLGNSIQKLFYLPEAHTDFVFAIIAEELGGVGSLLVLALFAALIGKIFAIGYRAEQVQKLYQAYLAYGIGLLVFAQVFINVGVNTGLLPTKGLTLPFLSYGGSSLIIVCMMMGILLRIDADLRSEQTESRSQNALSRRLA